MKTVLVTGATGGIGQALCAAFQKDGCRVIGTDLAPTGPGDVYVPLDLDAFARGKAKLPAKLVRAVGEGLDVLVNNAAIQRLAGAGGITREDWDATLRVNLTAPMLMVQGFLPQLEAVHGCVVNVSSIHARLTKPGFVAYATSKAALEGLTRAMAVDLGGRVRVNAVSPAAIETPMLRAGFAGNPKGYAALAKAHPAGAIGHPEDVAAAVVNLAVGPAFLTGSVMALDGAVGSRLHDPV